MNQGPISPVVEAMKSGVADAHAKWMQHRAAGTAGTPEGLAAFDEMKLASETLSRERLGRGDALGICEKCQSVFGASLGGKLCERCFAVEQLLERSADLFLRIERALDHWQSPGERVMARSALVGAKAALVRARRSW